MLVAIPAIFRGIYFRYDLGMFSSAVTLLLGAPAMWTFAVGGDIMLNGVSAARNPFDRSIASVFADSSAAYANLEIPLTSSRVPTRRKTAAELRARTQYILKADPAHAKYIKSTGFDIVSLANNHGMDYGWAGLSEMMGLLDKGGVLHCGGGRNSIEAAKPAIYRTKGGVRIAIISYLAFINEGSLWKNWPATKTEPGIAALSLGGSVDDKDRARFRTEVSAAKRNADLVFLALHWGTEKMTRPTAYQMSVGREWIRAGADGVLGAHPHVLQGFEMYRGKPILYSMGNLVSPRPGSTAVYRLRYKGLKCDSVEPVPASISGGVVKKVPAAQEEARKKAILGLNRLIPAGK